MLRERSRLLSTGVAKVTFESALENLQMVEQAPCLWRQLKRKAAELSNSTLLSECAHCVWQRADPLLGAWASN
jgi:hypothetical protein